MEFTRNNYKYLDVDNNFSTRTELSSKLYQKYSKILNNLLGINVRSDNAIFTKSNSLNIDLLKLIDPKHINSIFSKHKFKIKIDRQVFFKNKKTTFDDNYEALFLNKWKRYIKQVNETYQQTNMWPLFIGTYFLKGKPGDKFIYAPLVLKEVEIIIENNDVYIVERNNSISLNEKLIFLLEEFQGISIPKINDEEDKITIDEIVSELNLFLKNSIRFEYVDHGDKFNDLKSIDINNNDIVRTSGTMLLFAQPLGGALRNVVIDLIKEDKMDSLIKTTIDNMLSSPDESIKNIVHKPIGIARICPTDPSQENAIISSLRENTIIIGPPGTGKSQTISNILANILLMNKKALFISQKRVALEVVLERMKSLQYFTLQLVEHKSKSSIDEKNTFYEYMTQFTNIVKSSQNEYLNSDINLKPLISFKKLEYWKSKNIENVNEYDLDLFTKLKSFDVKINQEMINDISKIFTSLKKISKFDDIEKILDISESNIKKFAQCFEVNPKFNLLGIKIYDSSFKKFFNINVDLLNAINNYNLNKELISELKNYKNFKMLLNLENSYQQHLDEIPKTNKFISDETIIRKICAQRAQEAYKNIHQNDPKWAGKFFGRIQRRYAQPTKFISLFKKELKQLFNVFVSTPEALSSFIDFKKEKFDYVIFDEASQIFLEKAIPYLSISDKVIVAGDDQQMQPSNWFGHRSDVDEEEKEEENIDSLLTYAIENGIKQEMLELNYRSSAATLTTFSSKEFYKSNLKTLDNNSEIMKPIEIINVDGIWKDNQNEIEAIKAIQVLKDNIDKYKKIILLTLNKKQMELINYMLSSNEEYIYNKIIEGDVILKNLENIQGDEADLVIISIAYTKDSALSMTYVGRNGGRNALNVAITRAKDKMIVIKSIKSKEIQTKFEMSNDLRTFKNWIEFLELNEVDQKKYSLVDGISNDVSNIESSFEYDVINWLKTKKFSKPLKLVPQYPIGSYRIDIALLDVESSKFILGIEVDGFLYHSTIRQRYNDLVRQNFIESKGYRLIRISELLWKTNKDKVFSMIENELTK